MSRFKIAFTLEDAEVVGAVFDIEKDIEKEQEINGAAIGDIAEDETQARVEEVLSIEEFENELSAEFAENSRVEEVADNLTDLASVVGQIEEPTATDVALIQTTANMAVAGTEVDAQDVLPAVENFKDMKIVAEGIGEKASAAMASLRESGLAMTTKISEYLKKTFTSLKYYERKLIESKAKIAELKAAGKKELAVSMRGNKFFTGGDEGPVKDGGDLVKRMNASVAFHDKFSTLFIDAEKSFADSVLKWWTTGVDTNASDAEKSKLFTAFFDNFLVKLSKVQGMERSADTKAGFDTFVNKNLLGNVSVAVRIPSNVKGYKDVTNAEIREWMSGSYVGTASTLGIRDRIATAINGVPVTISVTVGDLDNLVRAGEKELTVLKKYLDKVYQTANAWSKAGPITGSAGSAYTRLVSKGRNTLFYTSFWTRSYGGNLLDAILKTVDAASRGGSSISTEGFTGGVAGLLSQFIPIAGWAANSVMKNEISHKVKEIERIAKEIEKVKNGAAEAAFKDGEIDEATYKVAREVDSGAIIEGAIMTIIPVVNLFSAASSGSKLQDLSKELKAKIKELKTVAEIQKNNSRDDVATEDFSVALEGVGGGIVGVLKLMIPGYGFFSSSQDRKKAAALTREIQEVAKQIAKLRGEAYKQAHDDGKITDDKYEKDGDANAADVVSWSWKDIMPVAAEVRAYKAGSQAQDLSKELKAKLKELKALNTQAE